MLAKPLGLCYYLLCSLISYSVVSLIVQARHAFQNPIFHRIESLTFLVLIHSHLILDLTIGQDLDTLLSFSLAGFPGLNI